MCLPMLRRIGDARAQHIADRTDQQPEQERHAPTPGLQRLGAEAARDDGADGRPQCDEQTGRGIDPAYVIAGTAFWGVFAHEGGGIAHLAAGGEPLHEPCNHQQDRRGKPDLRKGRQQRDHRGADAHQHDGERECRLAPVPVGIGAQHGRAERSHEEPDGKGPQRQQKRGQSIRRREIQLRDDRGEHAVQHEVVPLEPVADHRGHDGTRAGCRYAAADRNLLLHRRLPYTVTCISPRYASRISGFFRSSAAVPDSTTWPVCST